MTNEQLYMAIGIPILFNALMFIVLMTHISSRFADAKDTWRAELRRVEEVIDARLKHLEERR
jgi:hypothetical protein